MRKIAYELLKIVDSLDDLELYNFADETVKIAKELMVESDVAPAPARQPQIQQEPIKQQIKDVEAEKNFKADKSKDKKDKDKVKGLVEGKDFVFNKKTEG